VNLALFLDSIISITWPSAVFSISIVFYYIMWLSLENVQLLGYTTFFERSRYIKYTLVVHSSHLKVEHEYTLYCTLVLYINLWHPLSIALLVLHVTLGLFMSDTSLVNHALSIVECFISLSYNLYIWLLTFMNNLSDICNMIHEDC